MREIPLTQGKVALVDDEDFEELSKYRWHYERVWHGEEYARCSVGKRKTMHQMIMRTPVGMQTDHRDHNGLNNQKSNLRICTVSENQSNRLKQQGRYSSDYLGVTWRSKEQKWVAQIRTGGRLQNLGFFVGEAEAAAAYNEAAQRLHGEFARLNQIKEEV